MTEIRKKSLESASLPFHRAMMAAIDRRFRSGEKLSREDKSYLRSLLKLKNKQGLRVKDLSDLKSRAITILGLKEDKKMIEVHDNAAFGPKVSEHEVVTIPEKILPASTRIKEREVVPKRVTLDFANSTRIPFEFATRVKTDIEIISMSEPIEVDYNVDLRSKILDFFTEEYSFGNFFSNLPAPESRKELCNLVLCRLPDNTVTFREDILRFFADNPNLVPANGRELIEFVTVYDYENDKNMSIVAYDLYPKDKVNFLAGVTVPTVYLTTDRQPELSQSGARSLREYKPRELFIIAKKIS